MNCTQATLPWAWLAASLQKPGYRVVELLIKIPEVPPPEVCQEYPTHLISTHKLLIPFFGFPGKRWMTIPPKKGVDRPWHIWKKPPSPPPKKILRTSSCACRLASSSCFATCCSTPNAKPAARRASSSTWAVSVTRPMPPKVACCTLVWQQFGWEK